SITQDTSYKRFTPTITDIDSADIFLKQYFLTIITKGNKHPQFENYYRQYVGLWLDGKRCIFINASCRKENYFLQNTYYPKGGGHSNECHCFANAGTLCDMFQQYPFQIKMTKTYLDK